MHLSWQDVGARDWRLTIYYMVKLTRCITVEKLLIGLIFTVQRMHCFRNMSMVSSHSVSWLGGD